MLATLEGQRQTGEKTESTRVLEIGLGSSLRRCVTANAVAVRTSSSRARIVGAFLFIGARLYAAHTGRQPHDERREQDAEPDRDHVAGGRHVQELHAAEREHAGETEPERVLRDPHVNRLEIQIPGIEPTRSQPIACRSTLPCTRVNCQVIYAW
jgi:hypothetical protein